MTSVEFTHDGRLISAGRDRHVKIWDTAGKQVRAIGPLQDLPLTVTFTHDGKRVVAGDFSGDVRMWEVADGKEVASLCVNPPPPE